MSDFQHLRELLLSPEQQRLEELQVQLRSLRQAQEKTFERYPQRLAQTLREDEGPIAVALVQPLSRSLAEAVRQQPQSIVAALFPVIGPSIRKAIAEAMREVLGNLNQVMESSLTPQGLRWRLEAWRSGLPYAQVALSHALNFHLDHVFLIEPGSGLVLQHAAAPGLPEIDADAVAGMLSAINDFVHDAVARESGSTLNSATVGEHVVWLIEGPRANLAAFIRGVPPLALQTVLTQRLEAWHERDPADTDTEDDAAGEADFARGFAIPELEKTAAAAPSGEPAKASKNWPLKLILLAVLLALGAYLWRSVAWQQRIGTLHARLDAHPGFVLGTLESSAYRELRIRGLLDPIAAPLQPDLDAAGFAAIKTVFELQPFVSAAPSLVLQRAQTLLQPPPTLAMTLDAGVLKLAGIAAPDWLATAQQRAPWIVGIERVDAAAVTAPDDSAERRVVLERQLAAIGTRRVHLMLARSELDPAYPDELATLLVQLQQVRVQAAQLHLNLSINVYGLTDVLGEDALNRVLRERRAQWLIDQLLAAGFAASEVHLAAPPDSLLPAQRVMRAAAVSVIISGAATDG